TSPFTSGVSPVSPGAARARTKANAKAVYAIPRRVLAVSKSAPESSTKIKAHRHDAGGPFDFILMRSYGFSASGSSAASPEPALLSSVTIISPSAGVCAHSVGLIVTGTVPDAPFGTVTKSPWLIELEHALYFAVPATASTKLLVRSKPNAW